MSWSADSRLAERIRERVANCVLFELQDPRISFLTVTRVRLAKDLSRCEVFYSVLGTPSERSRTAHALKDARGFVQRAVAKILRTRVTPHLEFRYDESIEGGMRMTNLLDQLREARGDEEEPTTDEPSVDASSIGASATGGPSAADEIVVDDGSDPDAAPDDEARDADPPRPADEPPARD